MEVSKESLWLDQYVNDLRNSKKSRRRFSPRMRREAHLLKTDDNKDQ